MTTNPEKEGPVTEPQRIMIVIDPNINMAATAHAIIEAIESLNGDTAVLVHNDEPGMVELLAAIQVQYSTATITAEHLPIYKGSRNVIAMTLWRWDAIESGCDTAIIAPFTPIKDSTFENADRVWMTGATAIGSGVNLFMIHNGTVHNFGLDGDALRTVWQKEWTSWVDPNRDAWQSDWD